MLPFAGGAHAEELPSAIVCRAAIAAIMGREPEAVKIDRANGDVHNLSYIRASDKSKWSFRCRVQGKEIVWASEPGRWRTEPRDEKVEYVIVNKGRSVVITESTGTSRTFELSRLK